MPTYLLMDQLKLINTVWAVLLPGALNVWNLILARSYYRSIPGELREAAEVDGAMMSSIFSGFCFPYAPRLYRYFACISLWHSGIPILMP